MIDEHRSLHRQRHKITVNQLSNQLDEDREFAAHQHGHSAAVASATMGKAWLFGLLEVCSEIMNIHSLSREENDVTVEEKGRIIASALGRCANAVASGPY